MTTVYLSRTVTGPDGEEVELELAAEVSADREVTGLQRVTSVAPGPLDGLAKSHITVLRYDAVPDWALRQIDMGDIDEEVRQRMQARERGWP